MNLFFDSVIFLYLIAALALGLGLWRDRKRTGTWESRHPRAAFTAFLLLCSSAVLIVWGSFIEPRIITINRVSIDLPNFEPAQPVRVALISDIQVGDYKKDGWVKKVAQRIQSLNPDLVLLAGDIIQGTANDAQYLTDFRLLTTDYRVYAVLGDHDYHVNQPHFKLDQNLADTVHQALTNAGVRVLHNETVAINTSCHPERSEGSRTINNGILSSPAAPQNDRCVFALIGLDDWLARKTDFTKAISQLPNNLITQSPKIVLIHNPDFILDPQSKNADLILAGNTHGGQVRLPLIGPIARLPSKLPRYFDEGLFDLQYTEALPPETRRQGLLFITSGVGESGPRARLFNPPEIVLLELR